MQRPTSSYTASPTRRPVVHPREQLVETLRRIYSTRLTTTSGGNLSLVDEEGDLWITPARVDKGNLRPQDIVRVKRDGSVEGLHPPSSELPFHRAIYAARPDLKAVVHAHPVALVAFSIVGRPPETSTLPHAAHVCGPVGFCPYHLPGSERLGAAIAETFASGVNSVMLENHGVVVGGADLASAFARFETLEFTARTLIRGAGLGIRNLTLAQVALAEKAMDLAARMPPGERLMPFAPPGPPPATTREKEQRQLVSEFVRRGYRQGLFTSTEGSFSARVGPDAFVITAYGMDRKTCTADDLVLVVGDEFEPGKSPSRAVFIHRAIYRAHPGVEAVVNALPVCATAFSCSHQRLDSRTIPESYLFLLDVPVAPFEAVYTDVHALARMVGPKQPVALTAHNGCLVVGRSVLDAFDRLEVLEATADALLSARQIGEVCPMDESRIAELRRAFAALLG